MRHRIKIVFALVLLVALVCYSGELSEYLQVLDNLSVLGVLSVVIMIMLDRLLMTYKWLRLLAMKDVNPRFLPSLKIYCSSSIWGLFLPATIGADSARIICMHNMGYRLSELVASVLVERILGFIAVASVALVGTLYLASMQPDNLLLAETLLIVAGALSLAIVLFLLSLNNKLFQWLLSFIPQCLRSNTFFRKFSGFHDLYVGYKSQNWQLVLFYILSFIEQILVVSIFWVISRDLDVGISYLQLLGAVMITLIVARIPVSPGGLGVFEGTLVMLLALNGVEPTLSLTMALIYRVLQILTLFPWFLAYCFECKTVDTSGLPRLKMPRGGSSLVKARGR